jgi:4-aminobutyrate aminotransferase-like enzyme
VHDLARLELVHQRAGAAAGAPLVDHTFAERVFFCNSGAEANEAALKLARRYAHDGFGEQQASRDLGAATRSTGARCSRSPRAASRSTRWASGPIPRDHAHPVQRRRGARAAVRGARRRDLRRDPRADAGRRRHDAGHAGVPARGARLCTAHNALLILDEIQSGMGRTGALFSYMQKASCPTS